MFYVKSEMQTINYPLFATFDELDAKAVPVIRKKGENEHINVNPPCFSHNEYKRGLLLGICMKFTKACKL